MAILNAVKREIVAKIVYYGPGLSGKTLNIQKIHEQMDPANVGEMTSLATESDRTLFFDFVPIQLGSIAGLNTRFQLFTVPGQVFYNQTRRTVLENTDGVVFVADSQPEQLENNLESLANLEENLAFYGKKLQETPFVLQFNKQDIPGCMTEDELNKVLNKFNVPSLKASCFEGYGVMETLAKISTMVLSNLREQMTKRTPGAANTLKRTYSKEGVSDEQVVSNLLSDIAAAGGVAEARAAGDVPPAAVAAPAAPRPAAPAPAITPSAGRPAVRPAAIVPGGAGAKPAAPAAVPAAPKVSPHPTVPAAPPVKSTSISPEDLLNDLDAGSPPKKVPPFVPTPPPPRVPAPQTGRSATPPPTAAAPAPMARPPAASGPPPPPPSARVAGPAPIPGPPSQTGTATGLRSSARPAPSPGAVAKTAEELLENMEQEERTGGGGLVQESRGSFGSDLWGDDDDAGGTPSQAPSRSGSGPKPSPMQSRPAASAPAPANKLGGAGLFDLDGDEAEDPSNRTSVVNGGALRPREDIEDASASSASAAGPLRVQSVGNAAVAGGMATFSVILTDGGRQVPVQLSVALGDLSKAKKGGSGLAIAALLIGLLNLLAVLGLAGLVLSGSQ